LVPSHLSKFPVAQQQMHDQALHDGCVAVEVCGSLIKSLAAGLEMAGKIDHLKEFLENNQSTERGHLLVLKF